MKPPEQDGLLAPSDIAELADVTRGAVSNWRKRSDDFPAPVAGTSAKPLFSQREVLEWLAGRGQQTKQDYGQGQVWAVMNQLRGILPVEQAIGPLLAMLAARKTGEEPQSSGLQPDVLRQLEGAIEGIDDTLLGQVADYALERLARSAGRGGGSFGFIGSRTSTLLANLAAVKSGEVLYDPACGIGTALIQTMEKGAQFQRVVGHEINEQSLRIATFRGVLHDIPLELVQTDVLREDVAPDLAADVIICEPPFGLRNAHIALADPRFEFGTPPASSADTAWLQHTIAHLSRTGRGYVLTPTGTLHSRRESDIRGELLRRGCIEAIVGLPPKMLPHTSIPLALWVLRRPATGTAEESVLVIDASQTTSPEDDVPQWLTDPTARESIPNKTVPVTELLAGGALLTPQRWTAQDDPDGEEIVTTYLQGWESIMVTLEQLQGRVTQIAKVPSLPKSRVVTVNELIDQGVVSLLVGRPKERFKTYPAGLRDRLATAADVRDHTLHQTAPDVSYENEYPDVTQPNDVLVTTMNDVRAIVDAAGGHLPTTGVHRLRVLNSAVITPEYLAHALQGEWNERFQNGTVMQRADIRELEIPLVPVTAQDSVQELTSALAAIQADAKNLTAHASSVMRSLLQAVRYSKSLS